MPEPSSPEIIQTQKISIKQQPTPAERVFRFLEKTHFFESQTEEGFKKTTFNEWFNNTPNEQLIRYLTLFNDLLRNQSTNQKPLDGENVIVGITRGFGDTETDYVPPQYEDKSKLLSDVIDAIKTINSPQDKGLLAYYAIQNIHPFNDGNGRTGRLMYTLFTSEENQSMSVEKFKLILDHESKTDTNGRNAFSKKVTPAESMNALINREMCKSLFGTDLLNNYGFIYVVGNVGSVNIPKRVTQSLNKEQIERADQILSEHGVDKFFPFKSIVLLKLISQHPELEEFTYTGGRKLNTNEGLSTEDDGKPFLGINLETLLEESDKLTSQDILEIIDIHEQIKRKSIETLIDVFIHPDQHKITKPNGQKIPIKNTFIKS